MATSDTDLSALRIDRSRQTPSMRRGPRGRRKLILWAVVITLLMVSAFAVKNWLRPGIEVQLVSAALTSPSQADAVLTASGYVVARRKAAVASKGTGTLVFLGVEEGDQIKKGQVIARLEDSDVAATLQRAREDLRVAQADFNDAKLSLDRQKVLLAKGMIAQAEFDSAEARYKRVVASIEAAKFGVKEAEVAV